jgi:hypothetical protein
MEWTGGRDLRARADQPRRVMADRRRRRALRRLHPGDGSALPPFHLRHALHRTRFFLEHGDSDGARHRCVVDVDFFADDLGSDKALQRIGAVAGQFGLGGARDEAGSAAPPVALYVDGLQVQRSDLPAAFPVPGGVLEVDAGLYGLTRMHLVTEDGDERVLTPHPHSLEGLRARLARRFPALSRALGAAAILILLLALALIVPQLLELVTGIDAVAEQVGTFTSPIQLPDWASTALLVAGIAAALERALTLRSHWLIDADTTWTAGL